MSDKKSEKSTSSLGETIGSFVETIAEAVASAAETIAEAVGLSEPARDEEKTQEMRIGYAASVNLPRNEEEPETEAAEIAADDKAQIEAAIARARETGEVAPPIENEPDPLVAETLPDLPRRNAAKLQIQSPNRIHLYWSLAGNPFETLRKAFGQRANDYVLVTKLINLQTGAASYAQVGFSGDWWFNVRSNSRYRVDLGFYAPNRPFVRLLSSNEVVTPRPAPSVRTATEDDWTISTRQFVGVLTASGYSQDVLGAVFALQDEDDASSDAATLTVANRFAPNADVALGDLDLNELRWVLVSLAAGVSFQEMRKYLSSETAKWFEQILQTNADALTAENVRAVLSSIFGAEFVEMFTDENDLVWQRLTPVAVGASAIHFPEILFPKLRSDEKKASSENLFADFPAGEFLDEAQLQPLSSDEFLMPIR
jgi:hypothetical protein